MNCPRRVMRNCYTIYKKQPANAKPKINRESIKFAKNLLDSMIACYKDNHDYVVLKDQKENLEITSSVD